MYDIIGDIHGHANTLEVLLQKLGYSNQNNFYSHKNRKAIFVGDFIDRGPRVRKTLQIVRAMLKNNTAMSVMGNHEFNAICYHTKGEKNNFLRPHSKKNYKQHETTLIDFQKKQDELKYYIDWFKKLPIFIDLPNIRIVHASWDFKMIEYLRKILPNNIMTDEFLESAVMDDTLQFLAIENVLKGKEIALPENIFYTDKDGHKRKKIRIRWWEKHKDYSYKKLIVNEPADIPDIQVKKSALAGWEPYSDTCKPVFFGHYWRLGKPTIFRDNVCCVDYSIAKNKKLVAYRYNGEKKLHNSNFVYVDNQD